MTWGEKYPELRGRPGYEAIVDRKMPGLLAMAGNLTGAVVGHIADGCREVTPEVQAAREAACRACPHWISAEDRCSVCGCFLEVKRTWTSESCPLPDPKWGPV